MRQGDVALRRKFVAVNAHPEKEENLNQSSMLLPSKASKKEQNKPKAKRRKEIIKTKAEINVNEN